MGDLSEKDRDRLKGSQFGLPDDRKYPMPDPSHARNAKDRADRQVGNGHLTEAQEHRIDRKADELLKRER